MFKLKQYNVAKYRMSLILLVASIGLSFSSLLHAQYLSLNLPIKNDYSSMQKIFEDDAEHRLSRIYQRFSGCPQRPPRRRASSCPASK